MKRVWNGLKEAALVVVFALIFAFFMLICGIFEALEGLKSRRELRILSRRILDEDFYSPFG